MAGSTPTAEESGKDYWHFKKIVNVPNYSQTPSLYTKSSSISTNYVKQPINQKQSPSIHSRSVPNSASSGAPNGVNNVSSNSQLVSNMSNAAPSAAAAAYQNTRPSLKVISSGFQFDSSAPENSLGLSSTLNPSSANSTTFNNSASHNVPSKPTRTNSTSSSSSLRRLWFRKKSGGSATSLMVTSMELVDDLKLRILEKYPTSLQQHCDPADLVITVQQHSGVRLELQPDENIVEVIDRFFPEGMKLNDALEIGPASSKWSKNDRDTSSNTPLISPGISASAVLGSLANQGRDLSQRIALQRSRSYSQAHGNPVHQVHIPLNQTNVTQPVAPAADSQVPVPERHDLTAPHSPQDRSQSRASTPSPGGLSQLGQQPLRKKSNGTSVLLLPKQLTSGSKAMDQSGTNLVPLTNEKSPDQEIENWLDDSNNSVGAADSKLFEELTIQSPTIQIDEQGKPTVIPQINVLIVEDNPVNQQILKRFMHKWRIRFDVASNGREALEKWKAGGFHLILMDIQLPVMTGLEVTTEIRRLEKVNGIGAFQQSCNAPKRLEDIPEHERIKKSSGGFRSPVIIVALTASSAFEDKSEALAAGCNDFLTKPVHFQWLDKKIIEWGCMQALIDFDGWKKWNEERPKLSNNPSSSSPNTNSSNISGKTEIVQSTTIQIPLHAQS